MHHNHRHLPSFLFHRIVYRATARMYTRLLALPVKYNVALHPIISRDNIPHLLNHNQSHNVFSLTVSPTKLRVSFLHPLDRSPITMYNSIKASRPLNIHDRRNSA